jgi:hypothetical protein
MKSGGKVNRKWLLGKAREGKLVFIQDYDFLNIEVNQIAEFFKEWPVNITEKPEDQKIRYFNLVDRHFLCRGGRAYKLDNGLITMRIPRFAQPFTFRVIP